MLLQWCDGLTFPPTPQSILFIRSTSCDSTNTCYIVHGVGIERHIQMQNITRPLQLLPQELQAAMRQEIESLREQLDATTKNAAALSKQVSSLYVTVYMKRAHLTQNCISAKIAEKGERSTIKKSAKTNCSDLPTCSRSSCLSLPLQDSTVAYFSQGSRHAANVNGRSTGEMSRGTDTEIMMMRNLRVLRMTPHPWR